MIAPDPTWDGLDAAPQRAADCGTFERAGFRAYSLAGEGWRIVLSRVDVAAHEPRGLFTVYAPGRPEAFSDLDGYVLARTAGIFGGTNLRALAVELAKRLGGAEAEWSRRLDYLAQRSMRDGAEDEVAVFTGRPGKPAAPVYVFEGRMRAGRTVSLFGPGSAGKTTLADGLAVSACTGREIIPLWRPARAFVVGCLDWDEGKAETEVRLHGMTNAYGVELGSYHYRRMSRPLADCADDVGRWIVGNRIELLIVSPVNRAARSANGDPGAPIFELYEVLREFGTSNLLIDHVVGAAIADHEATREYGSVAKRDAARGSYSVYEQSSEPGRRVVVLRNTKPDALAPKHPAQAVAIEYSPAWPDASGAYDEIRFAEAEVAEAGGSATPAESRPESMVRILRDHGPALTATELCVLSGLPAKDLKDIARHARKSGWHIAFEDGRWRISLPAEVVPDER